MLVPLYISSEDSDWIVLSEEHSTESKEVKAFLFSEGILLILGDLVKNQEEAKHFRIKGEKINISDLFIHKLNQYTLTAVGINFKILGNIFPFLPKESYVGLKKPLFLQEFDLAEVRENFTKLEDRIQIELFVVRRIIGLSSDFSGSAYELLMLSKHRWLSEAYDAERLFYDAVINQDDNMLILLEKTTILYNKVLSDERLEDKDIILQKRSFLERLAALACINVLKKEKISFKDCALPFSIIPDIFIGQKPLISKVCMIKDSIFHEQTKDVDLAVCELIREWNYFPFLQEELFKISSFNKELIDMSSFSYFIAKKIRKKEWKKKEVFIIYDKGAANWIGSRFLKDVEKLGVADKGGMISLHCFPRDKGRFVPENPQEIFLISSQNQHDELKKYLSSLYSESKKITFLNPFKKEDTLQSNCLDLSSLYDGRNYAYCIWLFGFLFLKYGRDWLKLAELFLELKTGLDKIYSRSAYFESNPCLKNIDAYECLLPYVKDPIHRQIVQVQIAALYFEEIKHTIMPFQRGWAKSIEYLDSALSLTDSYPEVNYLSFLYRLKIEYQKALFYKEEKKNVKYLEIGLSLIKALDALEQKHEIRKNFCAEKEFYEYAFLNLRKDEKEALSHLENYLDLSLNQIVLNIASDHPSTDSDYVKEKILDHAEFHSVLDMHLKSAALEQNGAIIKNNLQQQRNFITEMPLLSREEKSSHRKEKHAVLKAPNPSAEEESKDCAIS